MLKSLALVLAIVVVINGRPQMWKNYGMREEVDVAPSFQDENEMPIYVDKRLNQRNPFELANAKEDSSSEEVRDDNKLELNSEPKNVGVELIFGSAERLAQNPFAIDDTEWDLSKYASLKDAGSTNEDSSEESKDTMQQFYLPLGVVVENPQGEILAKKEQIVDNSNSEESSSNEIQRQYSNDDETPMKFYNPPGVIIDRIVYRSVDEVLPSEQILEMPRQVPKLSPFEESNEGNNNDYANVYFPQGLVIDPYQKLDVSSEEQQVENVFVKEVVELERPMRDYDIQEVEEPRVVVPEMDGQEFPELEIPDVPEVPEIPGVPEVPEFPEVPEVPYADAEEEMTQEMTNFE